MKYPNQLNKVKGSFDINKIHHIDNINQNGRIFKYCQDSRPQVSATKWKTNIALKGFRL